MVFATSIEDTAQHPAPFGGPDLAAKLLGQRSDVRRSVMRSTGQCRAPARCKPSRTLPCLWSGGCLFQLLGVASHKGRPKFCDTRTRVQLDIQSRKGKQRLQRKHLNSPTQLNIAAASSLFSRRWCQTRPPVGALTRGRSSRNMVFHDET